MQLRLCVAAGETHQETLVSVEDGVGEGRTRAVVTGNKDSVQTPRSSRNLWQIQAKYAWVGGNLNVIEIS